MSVDQMLNQFCAAFSAKNAEAVAALFDEQGLLEFPFAGQRLVGRREIANGVARMCENLDSVSISVRSKRATEQFVISEGRMSFRRTASKEEVSCAISIVVERGKSGAARISTYYDTYAIRPWVDGKIFATG
ncbi:nuclear transport factor 2 family protein [Aminobacter anthyllidis]|uniref:Nuclear transport factor 2 family protein n=1 Tax=Aminobacter anthyllidis TaxID=1035067 RepID=A0A9X1AGZ3_9HYPH|nr:nuclear transport factor 2 family protein [Aminobacter anthyllidis]MBT1159672.1 nuclear transport factor 2 family protein [Aminobacter anthyllidis]